MSEFFTTNPSTGKPLQQIVNQTPEDFDKLIALHKHTFESWKETTFSERKKWLKIIREAVVRQADNIGTWIAEEQGQPKLEAMTLQIFPVLDTLKYLERLGEKELQNIVVSHQQMMFSAKKTKIVFEPIGTVLVIAPWNFSFLVPMIDAVTTLFCGNTVIIKPSLFTAGIALKIQSFFEQLQLPKNLIDVFICEDSVAPYLTEHTGINKIIFTGSTETGKKVMASAAKNLTPVILEMGGKDPAIVSNKCNLDRAVQGILWGSLTNAGQVCSSIERVYVHEEIQDIFIDKLKTEIQNLTVGNALSEETQIGPMINLLQLEKVKTQIQDAVEKGALLEYGGKQINQEGNYFEPTILSHVNHSMKVMTEETFGPVIPIQKYKTIEEAVRLSNESQYGLNASLWSNDKNEIDYFTKHIASGGALINDHIVNFSEPTTPWGGVKKSALGKTHSKFGLYELVNIKVVMIDLNQKSNLWWYPYNQDFKIFLFDAFSGIYSNCFLLKIKATINLFRNKRFIKQVNWLAIVLGIRRWF